MSKLNTFAIFGILFLSSILLGSGIYSSNQIYAQENENEAEVKADIEQENKCKQDTECENENKINNSLTITSSTQTQEEEQPETSACEDCFNILSEGQIDDFLAAFSNAVEQQISTIADLCQYIDENQGTLELDNALLTAAMASIDEGQYNDLLLCLQDAGFDVTTPS